MSKVNVKMAPIYTHEGGIAVRINAEEQLLRSVMSCMLWEKEFYEDGISIASRISLNIPKVNPQRVAEIAREARKKLRHVPLLIAKTMAALPDYKHLVADLLYDIIQRPDELSEFLAIYWKDGKKPISAQIKKGLAKAFTKFDAYSLAKWNKDGAIKLRDVLFLCHAKPKNKDQEMLWKQLIDGTLPTPDTWEVSLSAGNDKNSEWSRLLRENKLGALALLRNIRNMQQARVDDNLIINALRNIKTERILPFRFISAANHAPHLEPYLEEGMFKCISGKEKLPGKTVLLVDVSGSMGAELSSKSQMTRSDAAYGLAILARELCEKVEIYSFSNQLVPIPSRRGFALRDAIKNSQRHASTYMGASVKYINKNVQYDRLIVFTDEQSHDRIIPDPIAKGYMVNVASAKNGVGYRQWVHIDGFSESVFDFIQSEDNYAQTHKKAD